MAGLKRKERHRATGTKEVGFEETSSREGGKRLGEREKKKRENLKKSQPLLLLSRARAFLSLSLLLFRKIITHSQMVEKAWKAPRKNNDTCAGDRKKHGES